MGAREAGAVEAEEAAAPAPGPPRAQPLLLGAIASGTVLNPLNSAMIAVALVDLSRDFGLDFHDVSWLISVYYLASSVGLPVMGRLGDLYGAKRVYVAGLLLIALASGLAPFAPSFRTLLVLRAVQALGGSALYPSGLAILRRIGIRRQARALATLSSANSVAASIGPTLGGVLVGAAGWRGIFYVNLPVVLVSLGVSLRVLPTDPPLRVRRAGVRSLVRSVDPVGATTFAAALVALLWFLLSLSTGVSWPAAVVAVASGIVFVRWERRADGPFIDVDALRENRTLVLTYTHYALVNVVFYSFFFGVPSFLEVGRGLSAESVGLLMLSITAVGVVMYAPAVRTVERLGVRASLLIGSSFMTGGSFLLLALGRETPLPAIAGSLGVLGVSTAFNSLGLQTVLYAAAPRDQVGSAAGLFQTSRYVGTILSASLLALVFGHRIDVSRLHLLGFALGSLGLVILALSLLTSSFRGVTAEPPAPAASQAAAP